jgi:hypothetical protein
LRIHLCCWIGGLLDWWMGSAYSPCDSAQKL